MFSINREDLFGGRPYKMGDICTIHQLTLKEAIDTIGISKYQYYIGLFIMDEDDLQELFKKKGVEAPYTSVWEYLLSSAEYDKDFFIEFKTGLTTFIKEEILISPKTKSIIIGSPLQRRIFGEEQFKEFQLVLRAFNRLRIPTPPPENETPMQKRFRLKRELREKTKEKQRQKSNDDDVIEMMDLMSSLCVFFKKLPREIEELTFYQAKELLERAQARQTYHTELDMLMAGADSKKIKPINWFRNLQKEVN